MKCRTILLQSNNFVGIELDETGDDQLVDEKALHLTEGVSLAYTMPAPMKVSCFSRPFGFLLTFKYFVI